MFRSSRAFFVLALIGGLCLAWLGGPAAGASFGAAKVPNPLEPWVDWVLHDEDRRACPLGDDGTRICSWPGRLELALEAGGGRFEQAWELMAESWVPLPGGGALWPQGVEADGEPLAVVEHDGRPAVRLGAGAYRLTGDFLWPRRPEVLPVPPETGLLSLRVDGDAVAKPQRDAQGRLWLGQRRRAEVSAQPDALALEVMRRIDDEIPLQVRTRLALDVSGQAREVTLGPVLLPGGIPLRLDSPLPARLLDASGAGEAARWMVQVQLRPGRWELNVDSHHPGAVERLTLSDHEAPWPAQEVWAFAARPSLRQVELGGAERIDPQQTRLPSDWQRLPTYLMRSGETLTLTLLRRGALGADRLQLERDLRLDYSGDAFSVRDRLSGQLEQRWRLEALSTLELGQVRVDDEPRFITSLETGEAPGLEGVEVRQGQLDLTADARIPSGPVGFSVALPVSGWALPLGGVETRLHLPPGWDLLAVAGVDNLPDSWLARWSLLDIFLVLVVALGVGRLWGWRWGLVALATLVLIWPEPGAPRWVWLHVLVGAALLRVLPSAPTRRGFRTLRALLGLYYRGALLVLALIALPFLVTEMRDGLFPQLDRSVDGRLVGMDGGLAGDATFHRSRAPVDAEMAWDEARSTVPDAKLRMPSSPPAISKPLPTLVPGAVVQTGAGVPDWTWRAFVLRWTGPVAAEQTLRLWLLPPVTALPLAMLRVVLVLLLGLRLADWLRLRGPSAGAAAVGVAGLLLLPGGAASADTAEGSPTWTPPTAVAGEPSGGHVHVFPPITLLDELKQRLLEPPDCLPRCVEIPRMGIDASASRLRLLLEIDAAAAVALPVPGSADGWAPTELALDGVPSVALRRGTHGQLQLPVPAGRHRLTLAGPLPSVEQVDIPLPLRPRLVEARVAAPWQLEGVDPDGRPGEQLRLMREQPGRGPSLAPEPAAGEPSSLPPLLQVTRTLRLGLDWSLSTVVERLSPADTPVALQVPLVPGEAVTSPGLQVDEGRLLVALPPGRQQLSWSSTLTPVDRLILTAAQDARLTEVWRLDVSPIWHLTATGVPAVQNLGPADRWPPTWRPWPGERLALEVTRPVGVPGPTVTLDRSTYQLTPGQRATDALLRLSLRSSQGGRHRIQLPAGAELIRFAVDGESLPLALQGRALDLPLVPGRQDVLLEWREPTPLAVLYRPARVELGIPGVNAETQIRLGRDRWLLWTAGPGVGPAVLFWGLLIVLALAAVVLARSPLTPLGFASWLLLGVGLSQAGVWVAGIVTLWLFALGLRRRLDEREPPWRFNLAQVGLVVLSLVALSALISAIQQGLLGDPVMQVAGHDSSATNLNWYLDRHGPQTVSVLVVSVPIWVYRALMLAWALWLAWRLLDWLRWGWQGLAEPALWRPREQKTTAGEEARASKESEGAELRLDV
jgi:hypothetical protein